MKSKARSSKVASRDIMPADPPRPDPSLKDSFHRYLHIVGGFAVGGILKVSTGDVSMDVPIESVAAVHLPMVGGTSSAKAARLNLDCSSLKLANSGLSRSIINEIKQTPLFGLKAASVTANAVTPTEDQPAVANSSSLNVTVQGFNLQGLTVNALLNMQSVHDRKNTFPAITFGECAIELMLGKTKVTVELDTDFFSENSMGPDLEKAAGKRPNPNRPVTKTFLREGLQHKQGGLHRNPCGYIQGSLVKSVSGLPEDAELLPDGHTIAWKGFGKIVLGEVHVTPYLRRVTMVRLRKCYGEVGGGCTGGSTEP